jgi:AcrR family transcriptional regulator
MTKNSSTRKEQKIRTRGELIDSARQVIADKGIDETQIGDITRAAGVAHGTFYVHFKSKEELIDLLIEQFNERIRNDIILIWEKERSATPKEILRKMVVVFLDSIRNEQRMIEALGKKYGDSLPLHWIKDGVNPPMVSYVIQRFGAISELAPDSDFDPQLLAHAVLSMWARIGFRYGLAENPDRKLTVKMLTEMTAALVALYAPGILGDAIAKQ